jgi:hypothetical protein
MFIPAMIQRSAVVKVPPAPRKKNTSSDVAARLIKLKGNRNFQDRVII